jgi:organic hydroperoxide reductase OsmC/OhrA
MSEYKATIRWTRKTPDFTYDTYDRTHEVQYGGGSAQALSSAPEFKGAAALTNPEELLVAALSSCHMLTFLAIAAKKRLVVNAYEDAAVGTMSKNAKGKLFVSSVVLRPKVTFTAQVDAATLEQLHHKAHEECFIANSVLTEVRIEP